jgi:regulator of sigma E protease
MTMSILLLIVGLALFIGLVVIHEFGHFIMARRNGVTVEEFGIFFPPRLYKHKTKAGWLFTINLLPLGGFVKMKGEHDTDTKKGSFGAATLKAKTKIMAAGVVMNLLVAVFLLTILAWIGIPQLIPNQYTVAKDTQLISKKVLVTYIEPGSPAQKAGLQAEDEIDAISLAGYSPVHITSASVLPSITKAFAGKTAYVYYTRAGHEQQVKVTFLTQKVVTASLKTSNPKGYLGVDPTQLTIQRSTWSAPIVAVGLTGQITGLTFEGLGHALGGLGSLIAGGVTGNKTARQNGQSSASSQVSGPVGIFVILRDGSELGYQYMLFIIAIISLTLAIMNILPIPALDGGRLWITLFTRAIKKPLSPKREETINATGFAVLICLIILVTIVDVKRFF